MDRFLIAAVLALSAFTVGCQGVPPQNTVSQWRFPCSYRAFDAGFCDNLNGMPNTDFNLTARLAGNSGN